MNNIEEQQTNAETMRHILTLRSLLMQCLQEFIKRANEHDLSKLSDPEVKLFTIYTPKLKDVEYGSEEYNQFLQELKPALVNHYKQNSHHPEHYEDGIMGMNLFDLIEMLCDWKASSLRGKNGDLFKSLEIQKTRFGIDNQLYNIMLNTIPMIEGFAKESNIDLSYPH